MTKYEDAKTWARANLSPQQFDEFMRATGQTQNKRYFVTAYFEWTPKNQAGANPEVITTQVIDHIAKLEQAGPADVSVQVSLTWDESTIDVEP